MGILLAVGIAAGVVWWAQHQQQAPGSSGSPPGTTPPGTTPPGTTPPPIGPPQPVAAKPPGVYPAGTPGTYPITVRVLGGDGFGVVTASPGSKVYDQADFWYGPGTTVLFKASVEGGIEAFGTAFDHFDGPGVSTRQQSFAATIGGAGFVNGVFATFGIVGV